MTTSSLAAGEMAAYSLQLAIGSVFLAASVAKLADIRTFQATMAGYAILPPGLVAVVAPTVVFLEAMIALALIAGYFVALAASTAVLLIGVFATGISINLMRGHRVPCGCFGGMSDSITPRALVRLGLLVCPLIALLVVDGSSVSASTLVEGGTQSAARLIEAAAIAAFLLVLGAWMLALPETAHALKLKRPSEGTKDTGTI